MNSQELLAIAVDAIDNKKGEDTISLEMKGISDMTDYFVVTHGNNERQVQAIARAVKEVANEQNIEVKRMEGYNEARWILIDLADVVVHVFHKDERNYYNIEKLYQDAPLESVWSGCVLIMSQYAEMSLVYDQLTQDQPYEKWFEIVKNHCKDESNILDIGCGTGSLTVQLEALGNVTGMDLSVDMLTVAARKISKCKLA